MPSNAGLSPSRERGAGASLPIDGGDTIPVEASTQHSVRRWRMRTKGLCKEAVGVDGRRFDSWTRALTTTTSRRGAVRAVVGSALAGAVGMLWRGSADAERAIGADATCRCGYAGRRFCQSQQCEFDAQCCSRKCVNFNRLSEPPELGGEQCSDKRCLCRFSGARCGADCACCSGRCKPNGKCA